MTQSANVAALSGGFLDAYLEEAEEAMCLQEEAGVAEDICQAALATLLKRQLCAADSMEAVFRLQSLWLRAGDPAAALRVIENDGMIVHANLPAEEQSAVSISLAFWRLRARMQTGDKDALQQALAQAEQLLAELPATEQSDEAWSYLASRAREAADYACVRRCAIARHALQIALPERRFYRAWDDAVLAIRTAESFADEGQPDTARFSVHKAIDALAQATPDQDVDCDDWLRLGDAMVSIAPEDVGLIISNTQARISADLPLPRRRGVDVQLARLQAKAFFGQGLLEEALERSRAGRFILVSDNDDAFSALVLDWLLQAGRKEEAARLAFECVYNERAVSAGHACERALSEVQDATQNTPYWALTLAYAARCEAVQWVCGEEETEAFLARYLARAQILAPSHPAIDVLQALILIETQQDYAAALPLLDRAAQSDDLASPTVITPLWLCRMQVYGVEKALKMPFVESPCAGWCYNIGVEISYNLQESLPDGITWPETQVEDLAARYYEAGLTRFEAFFAGGTGMVRDADAHVYSMLCNNLAIYYRWAKKDYIKAAVLHRKGIESSPFAEHYDGLMRCYASAEQTREFINAADQLWHYANDHGYSRHAPSVYIEEVVNALNTLGRDNEIAIWLQRLDEWWTHLDEEDRAESRVGYLSALVVALVNMALTQPDDARIRLERALPLILDEGIVGITRVAGLTFERTGLHEQALELYQTALTQVERGNDVHKEQGEIAQEAIARCHKVLGRGRPWWKFWA